jgi:hypothetical protein
MSNHRPRVEAANTGNGVLASPQVAAAWREQAGELARWTMARLVVRHDVWGGYVAEPERGKTFTRPDGTADKLGVTLTRPARAKRGQVFLTEEVVRRHFCPRDAGDLIGAHTTSPDSTCRWGALDIDRHGDTSADPAANWRAARHWYGRLVGRGFHPLLTDSNGAGGYHLRVLLAQDVPAARLYHFLRGLVADYERAGLSAPPETFPKQAGIKATRYGNWMRVPGRHHSRDHWSRVWDGDRWLEGHPAIAYLLALGGDPPDLLPEDAELDARVRAYLARLPNLSEGQGRDDIAFTLLAWLRRDMGLPDDEALRYAEEWDAGNTPPKGRDRLAEILANVHRYGQRGYGSGLAGPAPGPTGPGGGDGDRPTILITVEESEVNTQAAAALAGDPGTYQRGGLLVRVVRDASPAARGIRRPYAPRIEPLPPPLLRERLSARARWFTLKETSQGTEPRPARPPTWCVAAVHARADWPALPYLEAVVEYPVLRPDGSVLSQPGYDPDTGLLLEVVGGAPAVPDHPSRADAVAARELLLGVIGDFPLAAEIHRAAWLAALLTPLARFAFAGPAPLFLVDANVRGAGKGLLVDTIATIVTGQRATVATYTNDDDELRKRVTSLALSGDRLILLDNLEGRFGSAVLDAVLTATSWKDRQLGGNRLIEAPMIATWYGTGNNVAVAADTARRICHIRLESPEEHPETRQDFARPDLIGWVGENRGRLLGAALTVLRAYCAAGRPDQGLPAWGSYESWSRLVRGAVVWAGLPDPGATRLLLQQSADVTAEAMGVLLAAWERLDADRRGLTAAEVIDRLKAPPSPAPDWYADLRDAVDALAGRLDARALGTRLRSYRRRVFAGRFLDQAGQAHRAARWVVYPAGEFRTRAGHTAHTRNTHLPKPEDGTRAAAGGECDECGECISPGPDSPTEHGDAWEGDLP